MNSHQHDHPPPASLARRAVLACVAATTVVSAAEIALGWGYNLLSVFAEGLHTLADLLDSLIALVLVSWAARPPDANHPFGHGKFDTFAGMIEGAFVAASGAWAAWSAIAVLAGWIEQQPRPEAPALIAMLAASLVYVVVSRYVLRIARLTGSLAVRAESLHLMTHIYITLGLCAGLSLTAAAQRLNWSGAGWIDPSMALALGLFLLLLGARLIGAGAVQLADAALPHAEYDAVIETLREFADEFVEAHAVRTRRSGSERHVDVHLVVQGETSVSASHELAHRIEDRLHTRLPAAVLLIHVEPATPRMLARHAARGGVGEVMLNAGYTREHERSHHAHEEAHAQAGSMS